MEFLLRADIEIELDDRWLQELWEQEPVDDQEDDALKCPIDTFKEALSLGKQGHSFDPVEMRLRDVARVNE